MFNWQDFIDAIINGPKYKQKYERCSANFAQYYKKAIECASRLTDALAPMPPPPKIDYIVEKSDAWVEAQLRAMNLNIIRLTLDTTFRITNRKNWVNIVAYDTTDRLPYIRSIFDCEDFTFLFKVMTHLNFGVNQMAAILDYKSGHAYGLVLFDESEHMIQEIQSDGLYLWTKRLTDFYSLEGAIALI